MKKKLFIGLIVLLLAAGCGQVSRKADSGMNYASGGDYSLSEDKAIASNYESISSYKVSSYEDTSQMIVYGGRLEIESRDYQKSMDDFYSLVSRYGIIIQSMEENTYNDLKRNYLVIRIPSANFAEFMQNGEMIGDVLSSYTDRNDITKTYNDNSIEIEALTVQKDRLMEMLKQAESIEDMLTVSDRLTTVETKLNILKSNKAEMETDVAYSTVNITIREVSQTVIATSTFWGRLQGVLSDSWESLLNTLENTLYFFIYAFPYLIIVAAAAFVIIKKVLPLRKKKTAAVKDDITDPAR